MKEITDTLDFIKIKNFLYERKCQESEKVNHRLGEYIG